MPSFRTGTVTGLLEERAGLQRCSVDLDGEAARAYALLDIVGPVAVGDEVVLNTTAVELGLGTGGEHVVHWNLQRRTWEAPGPGHIMKARYTSVQCDRGSAEELHAGELADADDLDGAPVVACGLHSQVPCVAAAFSAAAPPGARLAYVMTDGAGLPLATSDLVPRLLDAGLLVGTVTAGQAFGGDHEAVNLPSALVVARHLLAADAVVVGMGPGVVGTATRLGYSALEVGPVLDAAEWLGGRPVACVRFSAADPRLRHQGVSHHTLTTLTLATRARATVALPRGEAGERARADLTAAGVAERHRLLTVEDADVPALLDGAGLRVTSMGRGPEVDPSFYAVAGAAGTAAAALLPPS